MTNKSTPSSNLGSAAKRPDLGFTLIELVASLVLASMMMVALINVVWSALREMNQMQRAEANRFPVTILADQMRHDFINARGVLADPRGVTLHGYLGRDGKTDQATMMAGQVRYELAPGPERSSLVRKSVSVGEPKRSQCVWYGVRGISFESFETAEPGDLMLGAETGGLPPAPTRFRITVTGFDGKILWREVIHHHAG